MASSLECSLDIFEYWWELGWGLRENGFKFEDFGVENDGDGIKIMGFIGDVQGKFFELFIVKYFKFNCL